MASLSIVLSFVCFAICCVLIFAASGPLVAAVAPPVRKLSQVQHTYQASGAAATNSFSSSSLSPPPPPVRMGPICGDGICDAPTETVDNCLADCPTSTTPAMCGAEPHSDPQGNAVVDGRGHHKESAAECCAACAAHAAKYPKRPCNSWVFCALPHCWSADNGNTHLFGECWLKWQSDPSHPLYGQRGKYTEEVSRRQSTACAGPQLAVLARTKPAFCPP